MGTHVKGTKNPIPSEARFAWALPRAALSKGGKSEGPTDPPFQRVPRMSQSAGPQAEVFSFVLCSDSMAGKKTLGKKTLLLL